jgi:hypothetical protein
MLRKTIFVLATAAALTGALTADAVALATAHTGWDGLGDGDGLGGGPGGGPRMGGGFARKHFGGPGGAFSRGFAGQHSPSARGHFGRAERHFGRGRRGLGGRFYDYKCSYPYYDPNSCSLPAY